MSSSFFHEELALYSRFYSHERVKAQSGFDLLDTLIKKIDMNAAQNHNHRALQKYLRIVSTFCHITEKFNDKIETLLTAIDPETFDQVIDAAPMAVEKLRIHDWLHADLTPYTEGGTFRGCVSFIPAVEQNICFVKDVTKPSAINFREFVEVELDAMPEMGYVFAVEIQETIFRAVRLNVTAMSTAVRVRLIDVGETVTISPNTIKYRLNGQAQRFFPQAILCQVQKINGSIVDSLDEIGKKHHYDVKVREITRYMLEVDLYLVADDDFSGLEDESLYHCIIGDNFENPANEMLAQIVSSSQRNGFDHQSPAKENVDPEQLQPKVPNVPAPKLVLPKVPPTIPPRTRPPPPSPPKVSIPTCITSPFMRAKQPLPDEHNHEATSVSTNPFDFNGAHPKHADQYNNIGIPSPPRPERSAPSYRVGDVIVVNPSHIDAADQIYVQLKSQDEEYLDFLAGLASVVDTLVPKVNPADGDLVIAKYSVDGNLYRARVIDMTDFDTYKVFYVDYGNTDQVKSDDILEWHPVCDTTPFQAFLCYLPYMRQLGNVNDPQLIKGLEECCVNRTCKAIIKYINNDETLNINLTLDNGNDLFDELFIRQVDSYSLPSVV